MPVAEQTIAIDQLPVYLRSAPGTATPALYLHGIPTSSADFIEFLERTGGVAPDLIGFGRSAKSGHLDYTIEGQADFIETLLGELGIAEVKLVANGWGAAGGLVFAQRHPEAIERIVLINPLPLLPGFEWHRLARLWRKPLLGELVMGSITNGLLARGLRRGSVREDAWPRSRVEQVWEQFDQGTQRAILRLHRSAGEDRLASAGEGLDALAMPALVLWGARDPWIGSEFAHTYGERLPGAELEIHDDAGHWPWLDRPQLVERVASFLNDVG